MRALKTELDQEYEVQNGLKQSALQDADARKLSSLHFSNLLTWGVEIGQRRIDFLK